MVRPGHTTNKGAWHGSAKQISVLLGEFTTFALVLFVTRFLWRGLLLIRIDEECVGGVAHEILAHGIRFPLGVYADNPYDNGFFAAGLVTAGLFSVFGQRVLVMKLVPHLLSAAGAVATV